MCKGEGCSAKETCHRHTAKRCDFQSFFVTPPGNDKTCSHYWEVIKEGDAKTKKKAYVKVVTKMICEELDQAKMHLKTGDLREVRMALKAASKHLTRLEKEK